MKLKKLLLLLLLIHTTLFGKDTIDLLAVSPKGDYFVSSSKGVLSLRSIPEGKLLKTIKGKKQGIAKLFISPKSNYIVSAYKDGIVRLWDIENEKFMDVFQDYEVKENKYEKDYLMISSNEKYLVNSLTSGDIKLWDIENETLIKNIKTLDKGYDIESVKISKNKKYLLVGGRMDIDSKDINDIGHMIKVWNIENEKLAHTFKWTMKNGQCPLHMATNERYMLSTCGAGKKEVKLWDIESGKLVQSFKRYRDGIWHIEIRSYEGYEYIIAGLKDTEHLMWDIESGKRIGTFVNFNKSGGHLRDMTISSDEKYIAVAFRGSAISVRDRRLSKEIYFLDTNNTVNSTVISEDNKYLILAMRTDRTFNSKALQVRDLETGKNLIYEYNSDVISNQKREK